MLSAWYPIYEKKLGDNKVTPFFRRIVAVGGSPSGRRGRHFMERVRRPRKRRESKPRGAVDGTQIGGVALSCARNDKDPLRSGPRNRPLACNL